MAQPNTQDPHPLTDALTAIRDAVAGCRPLLGSADPAMVAAMLDTAAVTSEITTILLHEAVPSADDEEPGVGEALERAGDLAGDVRRHLVTGIHLMTGAQAITASVAGNR